MRAWRRWLPTNRAVVEHPLTPIRGKPSSNILLRFYALPGSDPAADFIDGVDGIVRQFVEGPAVTGADTDDKNSVIGLQLVPVAPEMQSSVAQYSREGRRTLASFNSETSVTDGDIAEIAHLVADRGGWSPLVEYLQWLYTREDVSALNHADLYAAVERLEPDTETGMVEERRASEEAVGSGLNEATAQKALESAYYRPRVRAGTHDWIWNLPRGESIQPEEAVVFINQECLRSVNEKSVARAVRATRRMFRDDDEGSRRRRVEEIVRDN